MILEQGLQERTTLEACNVDGHPLNNLTDNRPNVENNCYQFNIYTIEQGVHVALGNV